MNNRNNQFSNCNDRFRKSVVRAYSDANQTVATNSVVLLNNNDPRTGRSIKHAAGTAAVSLRKSGIYLIIVDVTATSADAGNVTFALFRDGVAIPAARATQTVVTNDTVTLNITVPILINDNCCCNDWEDGNDITIRYTGTTPASVIINNASLTAVKLA